jgi:hypothetical protein
VRRAGSGSIRASSSRPDAAIAAAELSRGSFGMPGALKSQYGTRSAGRCAMYQSATRRAVASRRASSDSRYAIVKPYTAHAWPRAQVEVSL